MGPNVHVKTGTGTLSLPFRGPIPHHPRTGWVAGRTARPNPFSGRKGGFSGEPSFGTETIHRPTTRLSPRAQ